MCECVCDRDEGKDVSQSTEPKEVVVIMMLDSSSDAPFAAECCCFGPFFCVDPTDALLLSLCLSHSSPSLSSRSHSALCVCVCVCVCAPCNIFSNPLKFRFLYFG